MDYTFYLCILGFACLGIGIFILIKFIVILDTKLNYLDKRLSNTVLKFIEEGKEKET